MRLTTELGALQESVARARTEYEKVSFFRIFFFGFDFDIRPYLPLDQTWCRTGPSVRRLYFLL